MRKFIKDSMLENLGSSDLKLTAVFLASLTIFGTLACSVVMPAHKKDTSRVYQSRLGYPAIQRRRGKPIEVTAELVKNHQFSSTHLGEGLMAANPYEPSK